MFISRFIGVSKDFFLNILASLVVVVVTQILVYPWLAREYDAVLYGVILTVMGCANAIVSAVGGSLNNARLLMRNGYEKICDTGDFFPILSLLSLLSLIVFYGVIELMGVEVLGWTVLLLIMYVVLGNIRGYCMVAYRLDLNFKGNLICSSAVAIGNMVGIWLVLVTRYAILWPIIFVIGEVFALVVLFFNTRIFGEHFKITNLFKEALGKTSILLVTTFMAGILIYLDRILLLPILGGESVAIYSTASFLGKCLGLLLTPIAGVLLSYFAQSGYVMTRMRYRTINIVVLCFACVFFVLIWFTSKWITGVLYPSLIDAAAPFLLIANAAMIIASIGNITQAAVLRYAPMNYQLLVQLVYFIVYLGVGFCGATRAGLWGFSFAAVAAAVVRFCMLYIIGERYIR